MMQLPVPQSLGRVADAVAALGGACRMLARCLLHAVAPVAWQPCFCPLLCSSAQTCGSWPKAGRLITPK